MATQEQIAVTQEVVNGDSNIMVIALAGSGKSTTCISSVENIFKMKPSSRVLLVTFSNPAAAELNWKLKKVLTDAQLKNVEAATFHSLNKKSYERYCPNPRALRISANQSSMVFRAINQSGYIGEYEEAALIIDKETRGYFEKKRLANGSASDELKAKQSLSKLSSTYLNIMEKSHSADFNMICADVLEMLANGTAKPEKYDYIFVDEFQDTDDSQLEWLVHHWRSGAKIICVGDDDQSIYGFRGAKGFAIVERYIKEFNAKVMFLSYCFRCGKKILKVAENLIGFNTYRMNKAMHCGIESEGEVTVINGKNTINQIDMVLNYIRSKNGEWAILSRGNNHLDDIEVALTEMKMAYKRIGGKSIWDSLIAFSMLGILELVRKKRITKYSHDALIKFGLSEAEVDHIGSSADGSTILSRLSAGIINSKNRKFIQALMSINDTKDEIHRNVFKLNELIKPRLQSKGEVTICNIILERLSKGNGSWGERVDPLVDKLYEIPRRKNEETAKGIIVLATHHASKGLEWDYVAMMNNTSGMFPSKKIEVKDYEEERRLAYVGITRARKGLVMGYGSSPNLFLQEAMLSDRGENIALLEAEPCEEVSM